MADTSATAATLTASTSDDPGLVAVAPYYGLRTPVAATRARPADPAAPWAGR